jgi:neutral ceramidase
MKRMNTKICILMLVIAAGANSGEWQAGVGRQTITPEQPMRMSGYAGRNKPADSKLHDLWVKALVLQDPAGTRLLILTMDLVGLDKELSGKISKQICDEHKLPREALILSVSHTHTGPIVGTNLRAMYDLSEKEVAQIESYSRFLQERCAKAASDAVASLKPAKISMGNGTATFAVNRRDNVERNVPALIASGQLKGMVDHDVPVLKVSTDGGIAAILFGYACHCTTLNSLQWTGDYAGFAQVALEKAHPGTTAMFFAGCGADQNPLPRRSVALAEKYGQMLADSVENVLKQDLKVISGNAAARSASIDLPYEKLPDQAQLDAIMNEKDQNRRRYGAYLSNKLKTDGAFPASYPYPITTWQLGSELTFVALGGEVVAEYSLRLKEEFGAGRTWVAAYCNDVMAYIPSKRVLSEGGYEGRDSMMFYGLPSVWHASIEELIISTVGKTVKASKEAAIK